jgi:hypothetical protein
VTAVTPILGSFWYFKRADMAALARWSQDAGVTVDFLADSGAFTAHTTGVTITVKQYAAWLAAWSGQINAAITLDVIGDPAATARNTAELADRVGDAVTILPVWHLGSPWPELERLCQAHDYVCLGGAVRFQGRGKAFMAWAIRCHQIAREHGTRLHGLGVTRPPLPERLPWLSIDSAYWTTPQRTGTLALYDQRQAQFRTIRVGTRNVYERKDMAALVRSYGGHPPHVGAHGYGRVGVVGATRGRADRAWLSEAALESWLRYADHVKTVRPPVEPPAGVKHAGPKIYLAAGSDTDYRAIVEAARHHNATQEVAV